MMMKLTPKFVAQQPDNVDGFPPTISGVDFIKILQAAFMIAYPKSAKTTDNLTELLHFWDLRLLKLRENFDEIDPGLRMTFYRRIATSSDKPSVIRFTDFKSVKQ